MLADYPDIINYLLNKKLIGTERIIENDLVILNASRRNSNFKVISEESAGYFLKQDIADGNRNEKSFATVAYEASVYQLFEQINSDNKLLKFLPHFYSFDQEEHLLILEAVAGSKSLAEHYYNHRKFSLSISEQLGEAIAMLHRFIEGNDKPGYFQNISTGLPWALSLTQPDNWIYFNSSSANLDFVKILQQSPELDTLLEELRLQWRKDSLIHGDLKWSNCLVVSNPDSQKSCNIKIVDWELASIGDPRWDVGSIFSEYLNIWVSSIPISGETPPDQFLDYAGFPLKKMHPSIRSFWKAYSRHRDISHDEADEFLIYCVKYAAARLLQTAYEQLQEQAAVSNKAVCFLQLCLNILRRPVEASVQLFGLPFPKKY